MRGASEHAVLGEKGIIIFSLRAQRPLAAKGMDFFSGALRPHKGDAARKFEALSSACQIVNK